MKSSKTTSQPGASKPAGKTPAPPKSGAGKKVAKKVAVRQAKPTAALKSLTPRVLRFIDEYLIDMNGTAAYQRAGYKATPASADANARRLLGNARISLEIARRRDATAKKLEISREEALQEAWHIVKADANELIEYRRFACPSCYPDDIRALERRDPKQGCLGCAGEGHANVLVKDTRNLSPQARALYAGVKITKDGLEVKMHSKLDALEKVFKHLGLYAADKKLEVTGANGGPIQTQALHAMTDLELLAVAQKGARPA